jgi:hypothetical protein
VLAGGALQPARAGAVQGDQVRGALAALARVSFLSLCLGSHTRFRCASLPRRAQLEADGVPIVSRVAKTGALSEGEPRWKVFDNFEVAIDAVSLANSYRLDDPAYEHTGGDVENDFLADIDGDDPDAEPVLVGAKILELRKLTRSVRNACCAAGLSAAEADNHCADVWDDLHRLRNTKVNGRRRTLTAASLELRASGRAIHPQRAATAGASAGTSADDGPAPPPPPSGGFRGRCPAGQCRSWWFAGKCNYENCTKAATHTPEAKGGKK